MAKQADGNAPTDGVKQMRILICEDEFIVSLATRITLEAAGHQVVGIARSAQQCLAMVRERGPDLVLMDIGLSGSDGVEATRVIMEQHPLPVVIVTSYGDDRVAAAMEAGACAYLTKPVVDEQLRSTLHVAAVRFAELERLRREKASISRQLQAAVGTTELPQTQIGAAQQITVSAEYHSERSAVGFTIVTPSGPMRYLMESEIAEDLLSDLRGYLDRIGLQAVQRAQVRGFDPAAARVSEHDIQETLDRIGRLAARRVLPPRARSCLAEQRASHLWLTYPPVPVLAAIPWELLKVGDDFLCRRFWLARSPRITGMPGAALGAENGKDGLDVLVISDPTNDLDLAKGECERIARHLEAPSAGGRTRVKLLSTTNKAEILAEMDGRDIVHFAGHAHYDRAEPRRSGWVLELEVATRRPKRILAAGEFLDLDRPPRLVFSNACASARDEVEPGQVCAAVYDRNAAGLAQAFMEGGIGIYVGTMWAISDEEPVVAFAQAFYSSLLSGRTAGQAMWDARRSTIETFGEAELTWASYLLFGSPTAQLRKTSASSPPQNAIEAS